ncbi:hypothetical protein L7F22_018725 [Adiantum nelumboides]|nr:hypothetical protein [Adiantum nelumboides]
MKLITTFCIIKDIFGLRQAQKRRKAAQHKHFTAFVVTKLRQTGLANACANSGRNGARGLSHGGVCGIAVGAGLEDTQAGGEAAQHRLQAGGRWQQYCAGDLSHLLGALLRAAADSTAASL